MNTAINTSFDPITLEVLRNALEATAQEMGAVLKLTAFSPNIKERMDASCAIFDANAQLVAQAEHVPVHLGSMLRAVSTTVAAVDSLAEGDVILVNDPFIGGSHLPDVMVIAPVFGDGALIGYAATRAHQADIGGMEPGSMPGNSQEIYQEGIIIPPVKLYRAGVLQQDVLNLVLANVRTPEERRGDFRALELGVRGHDSLERQRDLVADPGEEPRPLVSQNRMLVVGQKHFDATGHPYQGNDFQLLAEGAIRSGRGLRAQRLDGRREIGESTAFISIRLRSRLNAPPHRCLSCP